MTAATSCLARSNVRSTCRRKSWMEETLAIAFPTGFRGWPSGQSSATSATVDRQTAQWRLVIVDLTVRFGTNERGIKRGRQKWLPFLPPAVAAGGLEPPTQRL
jgi:hypothetical protein